MTEFKLTTADNPYSPFDEFEKWYYFDEVEKGYGTLEYLSRIADIFDDIDDDLAEQVAIDEILKHNVLGIYVKMTKEQAEELKEKRNSH